MPKILLPFIVFKKQVDNSLIPDCRSSKRKIKSINDFKFKDSYWMITGQWAGMGVYRSDDLKKWTKQKNPILADASNRSEDKPSGAHGDVVVVGEQAYIFYFTFPGWESHSKATLDADGKYPYAEKRA